MTTQPEALRLADILQHKIPSIECLEVAAAELRRLAAVEAQLEEETKTHLEAEARDMALILALKAEQQQLTDWEAVAADQAMTIAMLQSERDALKELLDDYTNDYKAVVNEQCAGDEKHCSCVPHLRKRIKEVEAERDALKAERDAATDLLRDFRDNYDCDEDAHKYGTQCRRCAAENLIDAAKGEK